MIQERQSLSTERRHQALTFISTLRSCPDTLNINPKLKLRFAIPRPKLIIQTETPNWGDIELPVVGIPCLAYLATQHLIVEVLSMEQGRSTTMEALGQCVISVKGVSDTTGQRFNEPVMLNGEVVAYMAGSLLLKNKAPDFVTM